MAVALALWVVALSDGMRWTQGEWWEVDWVHELGGEEVRRRTSERGRVVEQEQYYVGDEATNLSVHISVSIYLSILS